MKKERHLDTRTKRILDRASPDRLANIYLGGSSLAMTDNMIYNAWSPPRNRSDIFFSYSNDGGNSFSTPKELEQI